MIVFAPFEALKMQKNMDVVNLTSFKEGYEMVNLVPPQNLGFNDERIFDQNYANYILNNDEIFLGLMRIMMPVFNGLDICILISSNPGFEFIHDSLQKFIQARYGYVSNVISSKEDWSCVVDSEFSLTGISNLDIDKARLFDIYIRTVGVEEANKNVVE